MTKVMAVLVLLAVTLTACGSGGDHAGHSGSTDHSGSMDHSGEVPGAPAAASEADREVEVVASDELHFDPPSIEVSTGEVVTFVVRNEGKMDHEFVLGDETYQHQHEDDMQAGDDHMSALDNAVTVGPGETAELTWSFDAAGQVLYGCHEPGHYDGGMVGTIEVS